MNSTKVKALRAFLSRSSSCVIEIVYPVPSSRQAEQSTRKSKHSNQGYREKRILMSFQSVLLNNDPNLDEEGCSETTISEDWVAERWTSRIFVSVLMSLARKTLFTEVKKAPNEVMEKKREREKKKGTRQTYTGTVSIPFSFLLACLCVVTTPPLPSSSFSFFSLSLSRALSP